MSDYPEKLRKLNPWTQMDWPEICRASADHIDAQKKLIQEMREALSILVEGDYETITKTGKSCIPVDRMLIAIGALSKAKSQQEGETE